MVTSWILWKNSSVFPPTSKVKISKKSLITTVLGKHNLWDAGGIQVVVLSMTIDYFHNVNLIFFRNMNSYIHALNYFLVKVLWQTYAGNSQGKILSVLDYCCKFRNNFSNYFSNSLPAPLRSWFVRVVLFCAVSFLARQTGFLNKPHLSWWNTSVLVYRGSCSPGSGERDSVPSVSRHY